MSPRLVAGGLGEVCDWPRSYACAMTSNTSAEMKEVGASGEEPCLARSAASVAVCSSSNRMRLRVREPSNGRIHVLLTKPAPCLIVGDRYSVEKPDVPDGRLWGGGSADRLASSAAPARVISAARQVRPTSSPTDSRCRGPT